jgi:glycerol-3-phosphate dehydrogenase
MSSLMHNRYDVVIVGGGIYGACMAWEAALRGLSVALVEKGDFGGGASSHSLKTIYGGLRYLQHGDLQQMRESRRDSTALMRIAPHLVHPIEVVVPTYSRTQHSKTAAALRLDQLLPFERTHIPDTHRSSLPARMISPKEVLARFPGIETRGLLGGALFYDAQVYNPERLTLAFIQSAAHIGADVMNYAQVVGFLEHDGVISGIKVCDRLTDELFEIQASLVINATGAWTHRIQRLLKTLPQAATPRLAKGVNIVTKALYPHRSILGLNHKGDGSLLYFVSPWRDYSIIGTVYTPYDDEPDRPFTAQHEVEKLLTLINRAYPEARLTRSDVTFVHRGLLPMQGLDGERTVRLLNRARIRDHREEGVSGLLSVEGVTFTNARSVAEAVINQVFAQWDKQPPRSISASTPLDGGQIEQFDTYLAGELTVNRDRLDEASLRSLIYHYGCTYRKVLDYLDNTAPNFNGLLKAKIRYSIYKEMAVKLADVVFRRTELGTAEQPDAATLQFCADVMAEELHWSETRAAQEIREVEDVFAWKGG